jgi:hypothetical protein
MDNIHILFKKSNYYFRLYLILLYLYLSKYLKISKIFKQISKQVFKKQKNQNFRKLEKNQDFSGNF